MISTEALKARQGEDDEWDEHDDEALAGGSHSSGRSISAQRPCWKPAGCCGEKSPAMAELLVVYVDLPEH